jgi:hypothetical protein
MKKLAVILLALAFQTTAFANISLSDINSASPFLNEAPLLAGSDNYTELNEMFKRGSVVSKEEVAGWISGRCFKMGAPNLAVAHLLVGEEVLVGGGDGGPLFPPKKEFKIASLVEEQVPADRLDTLTPELEKEIQVALVQGMPAITEAKVVEGSLVSRHEVGVGDYRVRKSGNYLITQSVVLKDLLPIHKAGDIIWSCYAYNRLK